MVSISTWEFSISSISVNFVLMVFLKEFLDRFLRLVGIPFQILTPTRRKGLTLNVKYGLYSKIMFRC